MPRLILHTASALSLLCAQSVAHAYDQKHREFTTAMYVLQALAHRCAERGWAISEREVRSFEKSADGFIERNMTGHRWDREYWREEAAEKARTTKLNTAECTTVAKAIAEIVATKMLDVTLPGEW